MKKLTRYIVCLSTPFILSGCFTNFKTSTQLLGDRSSLGVTNPKFMLSAKHIQVKANNFKDAPLESRKSIARKTCKNINEDQDIKLYLEHKLIQSAPTCINGTAKTPDLIVSISRKDNCLLKCIDTTIQYTTPQGKLLTSFSVDSTIAPLGTIEFATAHIKNVFFKAVVQHNQHNPTWKQRHKRFCDQFDNDYC